MSFLYGLEKDMNVLKFCNESKPRASTKWMRLSQNTVNIYIE